MWPKHDSKYLQPSTYTPRTTSFVDRDFQLKYTRYIVGMAFISTLVFMLPVFYFANQNYSIFHELADLLNPGLAKYISKERLSMNIIFMSAFIANLLFWTIFTKKMTAKIAGPAKILRNHIRLLSRGDFSLPPVRLRDDDEFKELIGTYNYLYTLLKVQNERELEELKKVFTTITNPLAQELITQMINERSARINASHASRRDEALDSRHVS